MPFFLIKIIPKLIFNYVKLEIPFHILSHGNYRVELKVKGHAVHRQHNLESALKHTFLKVHRIIQLPTSLIPNELTY